MKASVLLDLVKAGKKPILRIKELLWDESFGEPGMLAELISISEGTDHYTLELDFSKFREHNMTLASTDFYLGDTAKAKLGRETGDAIEAAFIGADLIESVYLEKTEDLPCEFVADASLMGAYVAACSTLSYVEWLEKQLHDLVPALVDVLIALVDGSKVYMLRDLKLSDISAKALDVLSKARTLHRMLKLEESLHEKSSDKGA